MSTRWKNRIVGYAAESPEQLLANPRNWRIHPKFQQDALSGVLDDIGWIAPVIVNRRTGFVVDGHLRVSLAISRDEAAVPVVYVDLSEDEEAEALATFDPITTLAVTDTAQLDALLREIDTGNAALQTLLTDLANDARATLDKQAADDERESIRGLMPSPRNLPLDLIYTLQPLDPTCFVAARAGWKIGCRSGNHALKYRERWEWKFAMTFIDNEYRDYDHTLHLETVAAFRPKYATVRDLMTRSQCADAGITYYDFDTIMRFAEEIGQYAENVIVIPKYDCIDQIPSRYMLGYSVLSTYGATPMPVEKFRGRRVHLLGGSWARQLNYLALLGDDVVSLDNNWIHNIARFGQFVMPDGTTRVLRQDLALNVNNPRDAAITLSLGNIGRAVYELTRQKDLEPEPIADGPADE